MMRMPQPFEFQKELAWLKLFWCHYGNKKVAQSCIAFKFRAATLRSSCLVPRLFDFQSFGKPTAFTPSGCFSASMRLHCITLKHIGGNV
jgi:hypothetical protein